MRLNSYTEGQVQRTQHTRHPQHLLAKCNLRLLETNLRVVDQVLDTVDKVEHEREAEEELDAAINDPRHGSEGGGKARALEVPSKEGSSEVAGEV